MTNKDGLSISALRYVSIILTEVLNPLLIVSFALFSAIGYIVSLMAPVTIDIWRALFWASMLVPFAVLFIRAKLKLRKGSHERRPFDVRELLPLLSLLLLSPAIIAMLLRPSWRAIAHTDIYLGYSNQFLIGATPVDNVFLAGYPANHYWLFHAYVAAVASVLNVDLFTAITVVNFSALLGSFLWLAQILTALKLARQRTIYLGLLVIVVFCAVNPAGMLNVLLQMLEGTYKTGEVRMLLGEGADRRLHSMVPKAFNASGFSIGMLTFLAVLYVNIDLLRSKTNLYSLSLISASSIAALAAMPILALSIVVGLLGSLVLSSTVTWMREQASLARLRRYWQETRMAVRPFGLMLWFAVSLSLLLPMLHYYSALSQTFASYIEIVPLQTKNVAMIAAALLPFSPAVVLHFLISRDRGDPTRSYIATSTVIGLALASSIVLPDQNQYKLIYPVSSLLALLTLMLLQQAADGSGHGPRRFARFIKFLLLILVLTNAAYGANFKLQQNFTNYDTYRFDSHIASGITFDDRIHAYHWIREHTPSDAVVMTPLNSALHSNVLMGRSLYVKKSQYFYTDGLQAYKPRVARLEQFYNLDTNLKEYRRILDIIGGELPSRPVYAVVKDSEVSPEIMRQRGADLVYAHGAEGANVYLLHSQLVD